MNKITYVHINNPYKEKRFTVAMELPKIPAIETAILLTASNPTEIPISITLNIGLTKVNPKDNYNKKLGRELSLSRLTPTKLSIMRIEMNLSNIHLMLYDKESEIMFNMKFIRKSKQIRICSSYVY